MRRYRAQESQDLITCWECEYPGDERMEITRVYTTEHERPEEEFADENEVRCNIIAREGQEGIVYVNAYSITRHYGGHEEGGWWYNAGEPLASIPIKGRWQRVEGISDRPEIELRPIDEALAKKMVEHLKEVFANVEHGDIYSVLGGEELSISVQDHPAREWPEERPHYE